MKQEITIHVDNDFYVLGVYYPEYKVLSVSFPENIIDGVSFNKVNYTITEDYIEIVKLYEKEIIETKNIEYEKFYLKPLILLDIITKMNEQKISLELFLVQKYNEDKTQNFNDLIQLNLTDIEKEKQKQCFLYIMELISDINQNIDTITYNIDEALQKLNQHYSQNSEGEI